MFSRRFRIFTQKNPHASTIQPNVLQLTYAFDAIKNELKNRSRAGAIVLSEVFGYDENNRLTNWTNPKTMQLSSNTYDEKGRILENDQVGTTTFRTDKIYQTASQQLNTAGLANYTNDLVQTISYNENNDPVFIDGTKGDALFSYGLTEMRQKVTYGGNFNPDQGQQGKFTKYYSEDGSFEITTDNTTGKEKHVLYLGGSPYESNIVFMKNYTEASAKYLFLHKDYIGSILAITDEAGNAVEQRHYDAWGVFTHYRTIDGATALPSGAGGLLLDRGYTSHEHFAELGIIHMNGRLYDPLLRRFLNADESINDPNNTQCYNKYGYVLNNPLLYNDPSGEFLFAPLLIAAAIGAAVAVASYAIGSYIANGSWEKVSLSGTLKAAFWGAVSGAVTFGIGDCFQVGTGVLNASIGNLILNQAASVALSYIMPKVEIRIGDWGFSLSSAIVFGNSGGIGANLSVTYSSGDFSFSGGIGIMSYSNYNGFGKNGMEIRKSILASYDDGKNGISLGANSWSGTGGMQDFSQRTGVLGLHSGDFRAMYENDGGPVLKKGFGDAGDKYRTAALNLSVGEFSAGFNLFTGKRTNIPKGSSPENRIVDGYGRKYTYGYATEEGTKHRLGALTVGYGSYRVGVNSEHVRHAIQDRVIHGMIHDQGFQNQSWDWKGYSQYRTSNGFTSW